MVGSNPSNYSADVWNSDANYEGWYQQYLPTDIESDVVFSNEGVIMEEPMDTNQEKAEIKSPTPVKVSRSVKGDAKVVVYSVDGATAPVFDGLRPRTPYTPPKTQEIEGKEEELATKLREEYESNMEVMLHHISSVLHLFIPPPKKKKRLKKLKLIMKKKLYKASHIYSYIDNNKTPFFTKSFFFFFPLI